MAAPLKDSSTELGHHANVPASIYDADCDIDKTRVVVTRTGDDGPVELNLRIRFLHNRQQLFFQLLTDGVPLRSDVSKKASNAKFYLFIPPSSIRNVQLVDGQYSPLLRQETYQLHVALKTPPDLVGPKLDQGHTDWRGKNPSAAKTIASLEALAEQRDFTIAVPVSATARACLVSFCTAASPADSLQPLPSAYNPANLYGGKGGHKYVPAGGVALLEPASKPTDLPPYTQDESCPPTYDDSTAKRDTARRGEKRRRASSSSSDDGKLLPEKPRASSPPTGRMPEFTMDIEWLKSSVHQHLEDLKARSMARMDERLDLLSSQVKSRVEEQLSQLSSQVLSRVNNQLRDLRSEVDRRLDTQSCETENRLDDVHELLDGQQEELGHLSQDLDDVKKDMVTCLKDEAVDGIKEELKEYLNEEALESMGDLENFVRSCVEEQVDDRIQSMSQDVKVDIERSVLRRMRMRKRRWRIV